MGKECQQIPSIVCQVYGAHAIRVDLSYNRLTTLAGVEKFSAVEELILDNNCLDDNTQFPHNLRLRTLSLNKNNVRKRDSNLICMLTALGIHLLRI